jgi:hypothetical protein
VDWYLHYTKSHVTPDDGFPRSSPFWGDYAFHDNNRDGLQLALALTRAIYRVYYDWHPLVMHDLHESIPLLYVSTGTGPYNERTDPIAIAEWQLLANNDIAALEAQGLPGVWTWGFYDGWWPGYALWIANNHNAIGRFYETFGNAGANTYVRDLGGDSYAGDSAISRQWYRPWPPTRKVRWSSRDNVNYSEAGVLASLTFTADHAAQLLRNFWQKGVNSMTRGRSEKPYAYVIPGFARQRDPARAAYLVNQLERQGIEVLRRSAGDSAGDFVVRRDQPYGDLVVNLLGIQHYPESAKYPPYDDIAWTLGEMYGVTVTAVNATTRPCFIGAGWSRCRTRSPRPAPSRALPRAPRTCSPTGRRAMSCPRCTRSPRGSRKSERSPPRRRSSWGRTLFHRAPSSWKARHQTVCATSHSALG